MTADVVVVEEIHGTLFEELPERYTMVYRPNAWKEPHELLMAAREGRALVIRDRTQVDRKLLEVAPSIRVVARAGTGLDNVDLQAADELGVVVIAAPGANARSVAEHTLGLALSLARRIPALDRGIRKGQWDRRPGIELRGRTWGLVGLGNTGMEVARLVRGIGLHVIAYDPFVDYPASELTEVGVELMGLDEVLARATFVSLHIPLNTETRGLVDRAFIERMSPDSYMINVSRGEIVDEEALSEALESATIAGAALDVRYQEPPMPGALEGSERTVLTPHVAGLTFEAQDEIARLLAEDLGTLFAGAEARHAVGRFRRLS